MVIKIIKETKNLIEEKKFDFEKTLAAAVKKFKNEI